MNESFLHFKGITKEFPGVKALDEVSFSVKKGTIHALMGENGAGKSTLIKILAGIYTNFEGAMQLNGRDLKLKCPSDAQTQRNQCRASGDQVGGNLVGDREYFFWEI